MYFVNTFQLSVYQALQLQITKVKHYALLLWSTVSTVVKLSRYSHRYRMFRSVDLHQLSTSCTCVNICYDKLINLLGSPQYVGAEMNTTRRSNPQYGHGTSLRQVTSIPLYNSTIDGAYCLKNIAPMVNAWTLLSFFTATHSDATIVTYPSWIPFYRKELVVKIGQ